MEFSFEPVRNPTSFPDADSVPSGKDAHHMTVVYITRFFTNCCGIAFYVLGNENVTDFMKGTYMKPETGYEGPAFVTPMLGVTPEDLWGSEGEGGKDMKM